MPQPDTDPPPYDVPPRAEALGAPSPAWRGGVRWFAAEFLVVVTGILVALALQAWYEGRRDAARERAYLIQLEADLRDTERLVAAADAENRPAAVAGARLLRAYYTPTPPPRDSLLLWFVQANRYELARPVTATVEALVTTGDLNLIRSDSLRTAIAGYLDGSRQLVASQQTFEQEFLRASDALDYKVDYAEALTALAPQARIDSAAASDSRFLLPAGPRRRPFRADTDALLRDRDAHFALGQLVSAKRNMAGLRREMRDAASGLGALVAAEMRRASGAADREAAPRRRRRLRGPGATRMPRRLVTRARLPIPALPSALERRDLQIVDSPRA